MISVAQRQSAEDKLVATALQASLNEFNCPPPSFQPPEEEAEVLEQVSKQNCYCTMHTPYLQLHCLPIGGCCLRDETR